MKNGVELLLGRNECLRRAKGEFLFFTDGDCVVCENWIKEGLKYFESSSVVGVEGRIIYVSEDYAPTFSDGVQENRVWRSLYDR